MTGKLEGFFFFPFISLFFFFFSFCHVVVGPGVIRTLFIRLRKGFGFFFFFFPCCHERHDSEFSRRAEGHPHLVVHPQGDKLFVQRSRGRGTSESSASPCLA